MLMPQMSNYSWIMMLMVIWFIVLTMNYKPYSVNNKFKSMKSIFNMMKKW